MYEGYKYYYQILRKDNTTLALPTPQYRAFSHEIDALYSQGYIYCAEIIAPNPVKAVEIFTENEKLEVNKLKKEIIKIKKELEEVLKENDKLRKNSSHSHNSDSPKYYEIFGFSEFPEPDELRKRHRKLRQLLHPDKGGDKQLFQFIEQAFSHLDGKTRT